MAQAWSDRDKEIILWFLDYAKNHDDEFYDSLVCEISLGPDSTRACTRELQEGLLLMKALVEREKLSIEKKAKE